jgi:hypothetical protein
MNGPKLNNRLLLGTVLLLLGASGCDSNNDRQTTDPEGLQTEDNAPSAPDGGPGWNPPSTDGGPTGQPDAGPTQPTTPTSPTTPPPPAPTYTRTWYVSPQGNDSAAGTESAPLRTIMRGVRAAGPGERVLVRPGTYAEAIRLDSAVRAGTAQAPIVLEGEKGAKLVQPSSTATGQVGIQRAYWTVRGFEIDLGGAIAYAVWFSGDTTGSRLENVDAHGGRSGAGVSVHGGGHDVTIANSRIHDFHHYQGKDSHGIIVQPTAKAVTVVNNEVWDTSGDSLQCWGPEGYSNDPPADGLLIEGNDMHSTVEQAIDIKTCFNITIRRNRFHHYRKDPVNGGNATMVIHMSPANILIEDNDFYDAGLALSIGGNREGALPSNIVIRRNRVYDMITLDGMTGGGMWLGAADGITVEHNTFTRLAGPAIIVGKGPGTGSTTNLRVRNNLVDAASALQLGTATAGTQQYAGNYYRSAAAFSTPWGSLNFSGWVGRGLETGAHAGELGLDAASLRPGTSVVDQGVNLGASFCGAAPDPGALETGC